MSEDFHFDPFDVQTRRDPFPAFAAARLNQPVYPHPDAPIVSIFRYADVQSILKDPGAWSNVFPPPAGVDRSQLPPRSMLGQDPPVHTRLRGLVNQAFTPRIIRRLESRMKELADELFDRALEREVVDFVEAFTYPLPVIVISEIIGVPASDREQFKSWSDRAVENLGNALFLAPNPERLERLHALLSEMRSYFGVLAEERRRAPREDLLSGLVHAEVEGSRLTHDEMLQMLVLIMVAGNETTTSLIGNAVLELLAHPSELARLRADAHLMPTAVDEVLRFASPVQMVPRHAVRAIEIGGQCIEADRFAVCWLGSANRDEQVFARPDEFDVGRENNHHISFGFGLHYCLGANLARLETQVALETLLRRTRSFERADSDPLPLHPSIVFRGFTRIPLHLVAA
jgi:cytochrome P450